jgi:hypothetical protein
MFMAGSGISSDFTLASILLKDRGAFRGCRSVGHAVPVEHQRTDPAVFRLFIMKTLLPALALAGGLVLGACSRSDDGASAKPTSTPNQNLQKDAERLQQATAKIAKERERAAQSSPAASATP